jgi:hypothetical protein
LINGLTMLPMTLLSFAPGWGEAKRRP